MKVIGLVGGMSWESSAVYYRDLNLGVQDRLGGLSSPQLVLSTVDFAELTALEDEERWQQIGELLADAARGVERAGADFLLLCTTTFHKVADQVEAAVDIPLLHLADVVAEDVRAQGVDEGRASSAPRSRWRTGSSPTASARHGREVDRPRRASTTTAQQRPSTTSSCTAASRPTRRGVLAVHRGAVGRGRPGRPPRLHRARAPGRGFRPRLASPRHDDPRRGGPLHDGPRAGSRRPRRSRSRVTGGPRQRIVKSRPRRRIVK